VWIRYRYQGVTLLVSCVLNYREGVVTARLNCPVGSADNAGVVERSQSDVPTCRQDAGRSFDNKQCQFDSYVAIVRTVSERRQRYYIDVL
jgi:hypothetical protein